MNVINDDFDRTSQLKSISRLLTYTSTKHLPYRCTGNVTFVPCVRRQTWREIHLRRRFCRPRNLANSLTCKGCPFLQSHGDTTCPVNVESKRDAILRVINSIHATNDSPAREIGISRLQYGSQGYRHTGEGTNIVFTRSHRIGAKF